MRKNGFENFFCKKFDMKVMRTVLSMMIIGFLSACGSLNTKSNCGCYSMVYAQPHNCYMGIKLKRNHRFKFVSCPTHFESKTKVKLKGNWMLNGDTLSLIYDSEIVDPLILIKDSLSKGVWICDSIGYFKKVRCGSNAMK